MMNFRKLRVVFFGSLLAFAAGCELEDPKVGTQISNTATTTVKVATNLRLGVDAKRAFDRFVARDSGYGAMYITADGQGWDWYVAGFTPRSSDRAARIRCNAKNNNSCKLYAVMTPISITGDFVVPRTEFENVAEAFQKNGTGNWRALATNDLGHYGNSWNFRSRSEARKRAMLECQASAARTRAKVERRVRIAQDAANLYTCRILTLKQN